MVRTLFTASVLLLLFTGVFAEDAVECNPSNCTLPLCHCSSTEAPDNIPIADLPHFVVLSFDDAVTVSNYDFYRQIGDRKNPNYCDVQMSFFVSHENTDYTLVNDLHRRGHDIAIHSVTHLSDVQNYWRNMTKESWKKEILQQKKMLNLYGKIPNEDIKGWRTPFLEVGGNVMYEALAEAGIEYDCSWPSLHYTPWFKQFDGSINGALWPYTLDYLSIQDQTIGTKPSQSYPGLWVSPMTDLQDNRGIECSMLDGCQSSEDGELETSEEAVLQLLKRNFKAGLTKRTPFGIYVHHSWFIGYHNRKPGILKFLNYLNAFPEVYIVSVKQLIAWMKNPVAIKDLAKHEAFQCTGSLPVNKLCPEADQTNCRYSAPLPIDQTEINMKICGTQCPENYPYLDNIHGEDSYQK